MSNHRRHCGVSLLVINYILVTIQERREGKTSATPAPMDWDAANDSQLRDFITAGQKINAIKRYRELTGLGLKEAKDAIEYITLHPWEQGEKKGAAPYDTQDAGVRDLIKAGKLDEAIEVYRKFAGVDEYTAKDAVWKIEQDMKYEADAESRLNDEPLDDPSRDPYLQSLVMDGNKIEAIKEYRQRTGLGLREAKDAIDALEKQLKQG
jgi:ribosomal protein L7/L12